VRGCMEQRLLSRVIGGQARCAVEMTLDGGGIVRTRWCDTKGEAEREAEKGYVYYVEDYPHLEEGYHEELDAEV